MSDHNRTRVESWKKAQTSGKTGEDNLSKFKAKVETPPMDEPLYNTGPYMGSVPERSFFQQNLEMSQFLTINEQVYDELESKDNRFSSTLPKCAFVHGCNSYLQLNLIHKIREENDEPRFRNEDDQLKSLPADLTLPAPITEFVSHLTTVTVPDGSTIRPNFCDAIMPQPGIPAQADAPALGPGSFGRITADNHDAYEVNISPLITHTVLDRTRRQIFAAYNPLPNGAFPHQGVPSVNLLGYVPAENLQRLRGDGINKLNALNFVTDDSILGRVRYSADLMELISSTMKGKSQQMKMTTGPILKGKPSPGASLVTRVETATAGIPVRMMPAPIYSSFSFTNIHENLAGYFGFKRERTAAAPGYCYTVRGEAPAGWAATINSFFTMRAPFGSTMASDRPKLRDRLYVTGKPGLLGQSVIRT